MTTPPTLMSKKETASFLGISERTLDRWHILRKGPARITAGRRILYRQEALVGWLQANEISPITTFSEASYGND